jgi:hypothetical protein
MTRRSSSSKMFNIPQKVLTEQTPIHMLFGTAVVRYAASRNGITQEIVTYMSKILWILLVYFGSSKKMDRRVKRIILLYAPMVMSSGAVQPCHHWLAFFPNLVSESYELAEFD